MAPSKVLIFWGQAAPLCAHRAAGAGLPLLFKGGIPGQAVCTQHVLHHVDVGDDVHGIGGKQLVQLGLEGMHQRVHRLLNAVFGLGDVLTLR